MNLEESCFDLFDVPLKGLEIIFKISRVVFNEWIAKKAWIKNNQFTTGDWYPKEKNELSGAYH